jgi:hypothetical protein
MMRPKLSDGNFVENVPASMLLCRKDFFKVKTTDKLNTARATLRRLGELRARTNIDQVSFASEPLCNASNIYFSRMFCAARQGAQMWYASVAEISKPPYFYIKWSR